VKFNSHVHKYLHPNKLDRLLSTISCSEYDEIAWELLYNFESREKYFDALSSDYSDPRLNIPFLAIQPQDDPLHQVFNCVIS
jgi:predicted alpha/beta-fold hydrolase